MPHMLVQQEGEDLARWKSVFGWDSLENARCYARNPELKVAMQEAGLTESPI